MNDREVWGPDYPGDGLPRQRDISRAAAIHAAEQRVIEAAIECRCRAQDDEMFNACEALLALRAEVPR